MGALSAVEGFRQTLVHTGQHYDINMSDVFFSELELAAPDVNLEVGSGSHGRVTGEIMVRLEPVLERDRPHMVVIYGDVNSTLAAALVCSKMGIPTAHVEAGLRSFDRAMPEEINRVVADQLGHVLFTTEEAAAQNLEREGIPADRVHFVGNVMIDSLVKLLPRASQMKVAARFGLPDKYVLVTLHRPHNVDNPASLTVLAATLARLAREAAVVFPAHPRTRDALEQHGLAELLSGCHVLPPLGYVDFLALERAAAVVLTDSGGVQEETTYLGVPCLTLRPNTERPVTV
ncbi:MAG TPA: UDP-N-acetylglucosamine 2-epimerase (non-hydrolyzing), partial [Chloroflexota bacterium]